MIIFYRVLYHQTPFKMALLLAVKHNRAEVVEFLLLIPDLDVNLQDEDGEAALMIASRRGYTKIVELLLSGSKRVYITRSAGQRLDINIQDEWGMTALIRASDYGHVEIVKLLLSRPETNVNLQNEYGWTALMVASRHGHTAIVEQLLLRSDIDVNFRSKYGSTALIMASGNGRTEIVSLLENHIRI